jgi:hypothetical protein
MFRIHLPKSRVTMILNLVVRPTVPVAVALPTPEHVVRFRIGGLDLARPIGATFGSYTTIFELNVLGRGSRDDTMSESVRMSMSASMSGALRGRAGRRVRGGERGGSGCCCDISVLDCGRRSGRLRCARASGGD